MDKKKTTTKKTAKVKKNEGQKQNTVIVERQ